MQEQVYLKPLTREYLQEYIKLVNDPEVQKNTSPYAEFKKFKTEELESWLKKIDGREDRRDYAILRGVDHVFLGEVVLNEFNEGKANIRIALMPKFFGKGYGYLAMRLAIEYGRKLDLKEITLSVFDLNERGLYLYKKLGFEITGQGTFEGFEETYMRLKL